MKIETERELIDEFVASLKALPEVRILRSLHEPVTNEWRVDRLIELDFKGQNLRLLVEAKQSGYPRDIQVGLRQLREYTNQTSRLIPVYIAPSLSAGSRELLRAQGVGYWDSSGSLYLNTPSSLIWIDFPPPPVKQRVDQIYRGRRAQVLHALLLDHSRHWHIADLVAEAHVSQGTVHQVLSVLEECLWVERRGKGPQTTRILREPGKLLDAWAQNHSLSKYTPIRLHRWAQRVDDLWQPLTNVLSRGGVEHALTLDAGAKLVAPFTFGERRFEVLVRTTKSLAEQVVGKEFQLVDEGENVTLLATDEQSPFMSVRQIDGRFVVSDIQLYLDLYASPRRGREQAQHLREQRLTF